MTIAEAYRRVGKIDLRNQVPIIIELTKEDIIKLNQSQLYTESVDRDGDALGGYAWREYEEMKTLMNPQLGGRVDLFLTGGFYDGFYVEVKGSEFFIGSKDSKAKQLEFKYGKDIFGLTDYNRNIYALGVFYSAVKNYIQNLTGFGFR